MNELLVWWYLFVNSNIDLIIMTITLLVVAGLMLEVIKLNKRVKEIEERADWNVQDLTGKIWHLEDRFSNDMEGQVQVNINVTKDIIELGKRLQEFKTKRKTVRK